MKHNLTSIYMYHRTLFIVFTHMDRNVHWHVWCPCDSMALVLINQLTFFN